MKFKTKVIEIDAWKWDCGEPMPDCLFNDTRIIFYDNTNSCGEIESLEGKVTFHSKHWILLDTEGNPYPCHDTVFQKKYERS